MLSTLGSDVWPVGILQTAVMSLGLFFGAVINANIFGELSLIFQQLDKEQKFFQNRLTHTNTAMINLNLPADIRLIIRDSLYKNQPTMLFQRNIKIFFKEIKPS